MYGKIVDLGSFPEEAAGSTPLSALGPDLPAGRPAPPMVPVVPAPPPPPPKDARNMSCWDISQHVRRCPVCVRLYNPPVATLQWIILALVLLCAFLVWKLCQNSRMFSVSRRAGGFGRSPSPFARY